MTVIRRALPFGDYSLPGFETSMAIERKSLADYVGTVIHGRDRFARELTGLAQYDFGCVVVEGSLEDIAAHRYRSDASPNSLLGTTYSIIADYHVPVFFCGDRQLACRFVEGLLRRYRRKATE